MTSAKITLDGNYETFGDLVEVREQYKAQDSGFNKARLQYDSASYIQAQIEEQRLGEWDVTTRATRERIQFLLDNVPEGTTLNFQPGDYDLDNGLYITRRVSLQVDGAVFNNFVYVGHREVSWDRLQIDGSKQSRGPVPWGVVSTRGQGSKRRTVVKNVWVPEIIGGGYQSQTADCYIEIDADDCKMTPIFSNGVGSLVVTDYRNFVTKAGMTAGGSGYPNGTFMVPVTGATSSATAFAVAKVESGAITQFHIVDPGIGFTANEALNLGTAWVSDTGTATTSSGTGFTGTAGTVNTATSWANLVNVKASVRDATHRIPNHTGKFNYCNFWLYMEGMGIDARYMDFAQSIESTFEVYLLVNDSQSVKPTGTPMVRINGSRNTVKGRIAHPTFTGDLETLVDAGTQPRELSVQITGQSSNTAGRTIMNRAKIEDWIYQFQATLSVPVSTPTLAIPIAEFSNTGSWIVTARSHGANRSASHIVTRRGGTLQVREARMGRIGNGIDLVPAAAGLQINSTAGGTQTYTISMIKIGE